MTFHLFEEDADSWVLPWAILTEVDYLLGGPRLVPRDLD